MAPSVTSTGRRAPLARLGTLSLLLTLFAAQVHSAAAAIPVSAPPAPPPSTANVVSSNFLGLSVELSFINYYFGNTTAQTPEPVVRYLAQLRARGSGQPVRVRLGGNSMDSSTYVPDQPAILELTDPTANVNDQPVDFGDQVFDVMSGMSRAVGGVQYLIGLSLRQPNNSNIPLLAGAAAKALGNDLDAYLLGNEPDLYSKHGQRPDIANYTVDDYITDYSTVFNNLQSTPADGNVLSLDNIAGPTICCFWDLASILQSGWLDKYSSQLKYITLQHYPQDTCQGHPSFGVEHYIVHANTVGLANWQRHGLDLAAAAGKPVLMDEFNSISCGGVDGISNTFGVGLWTADYALQMAAAGYAGAYLHTREPGITYNPFDPPAAVAGGAGAWATNTPYYAMLAVSEALGAAGAGGARVVDLDVLNSTTDGGATAAGYAVYAAKASAVGALVLFNYQNASGALADFALDGALLGASAGGAVTVTVRYLAAGSVNEKTEIAYGGETYAGVGDAQPIQATFATGLADKNVTCTGGCTVQVPGPGLAVVFVGGAPRSEAATSAAALASVASPSTTTTANNGGSNATAGDGKNATGDGSSDGHSGSGVGRGVDRATVVGVVGAGALALLALL